MRRIAIVGSREYGDMKAVRAFVRSIPKGSTVVSGGARGVDTVAAEEAVLRGLTVSTHSALWGKHGKSAGFLRNKQIVEEADEVVAFWDGKSRGTKHTIDLARKAGKPVKINPAPIGSLEEKYRKFWQSEPAQKAIEDVFGKEVSDGKHTDEGADRRVHSNHGGLRRRA